MAMYAEATRNNYSPEYRYQTSEHGHGATKNHDFQDEYKLREDQKDLSELAKALEELAQR